MEHLSEVNGDTLADGLIYWILNIQLFEGVVTRIEHTKNTNDTIMIDFVIAKIERQELIVSEKQFCNHHCTIGFDFILIQI